MSKCTVCDREITAEEPKLLSISAFGNPKYLCDECASDIEEITLGREFEKIGEAMERLGKKMADSSPDNSTFSTVNEIMEESAERAKLIREGKYDFSLDDEPEDEGGFDEIPEELQETEEDRELDRQDEENLKKFNKVYNILLAIIIAAILGFWAWRLLDIFVFK